MGKMFFNILATFAEFEVDLLRMRTREGMAVAKAKGKLQGKQPKLTARQQTHLVTAAPQPASTPSPTSLSSSPSAGPRSTASWNATRTHPRRRPPAGSDVLPFRLPDHQVRSRRPR